MKYQYVRSPEIVQRGVITCVNGRTAIVLFDNKKSARLNLIDGCVMSSGETSWSPAIKFTTTPDVPRLAPTKTRVVALMGRSPEWVHLWALEDDYLKQLVKFEVEMQELKKQETLRQEAVNQERQARLQKEERRNTLLRLIPNDRFCLMRAHKFDQENEPRPGKAVVACIKLIEILRLIDKGTVEFVPSSKKGNDTTLMWFEREISEGKWKKVSLDWDDIEYLLDLDNGKEVIEPAFPSIISRVFGRENLAAA